MLMHPSCCPNGDSSANVLQNIETTKDNNNNINKINNIKEINI